MKYGRCGMLAGVFDLVIRELTEEDNTCKQWKFYPSLNLKISQAMHPVSFLKMSNEVFKVLYHTFVDTFTKGTKTKSFLGWLLKYWYV